MTLRLSNSSAKAGRPRVLMLTHRVPYPPDRGDRIRAWQMLRRLARSYDVSLACTSDAAITEAQQAALATHTTAIHVARLSRAQSMMRAGRALLAGSAMTPAVFHEPDLTRVVTDWHKRQPFDLVLTFCSGMIEHARAVMSLPNPPRHLLDLVDVDSVKWARYAERGAPWKRPVYRAEASRLRRVEAGETTLVDAITVISRDEARRYCRHVTTEQRVVVVGNGVDLDYFHPLPDVADPVLAFVGVLNYRPNVEAACWFARRVMPILRRRVPNAALLIIGRHPTRSVRRLDRLTGVEVVGPVDDVREQLARSSIVAAPLQTAMGVQNKVLEAMASRRAVLCTPEAATGIDARPGFELVTAQTPVQFADKATRLLRDPAHRQRVARAARRRVEQRYTWNHRLAPLDQLVSELIEPTALSHTLRRAA